MTRLVAFTMLSFKDDTLVMFSNAQGETDNTPYDFSNTLLQPVNLQDTEVGLKDISFPSYVHENHEDYQWIITKDTLSLMSTFHGDEKMPVSMDTLDPRHKAQWLAQDRILWFSLAHGSIHTVKEALQRTLGQANKLFYDHDKNYDSARDFELVINGNTATIYMHDDDAGLALFFNRRLATLIGFHTREPQKMNSEAFTVVRMPHDPPKSSPVSSLPGTIKALVAPSDRQAFLQYAGLHWNEKHDWWNIYMAEGILEDVFGGDTFYSVLDRGFNTQFLDDPFFEANPQRQPERLFIYANFVDETWVGDEQKPLLSVIGNPDMRLQESRPSCHVTFRNIGYVKAASKVLTNLRVWIEDEQGNKRENVRGTTMLVLHFRHNRKRI